MLADKTEMDLHDPLVMLFRRTNLESLAREQQSDLICPRCTTNLPYIPMTVAQVPDGVDANFNPVSRLKYFCTLCEVYFVKASAVVPYERKEKQLEFFV